MMGLFIQGCFPQIPQFCLLVAVKCLSPAFPSKFPKLEANRQVCNDIASLDWFSLSVWSSTASAHLAPRYGSSVVCICTLMYRQVHSLLCRANNCTSTCERSVKSGVVAPLFTKAAIKESNIRRYHTGFGDLSSKSPFCQETH